MPQNYTFLFIPPTFWRKIYLSTEILTDFTDSGAKKMGKANPAVTLQRVFQRMFTFEVARRIK